MLVGPEDLRHAARVGAATLAPATREDWEVAAGDLDWSCRRTLDHIVDALLFYSGHLASRATTRTGSLRDGDPAAGPEQLLDALQLATAVLASLVEAAPEGTRAYHPAGMADPEGFAAMGCDEVLVHTGDIAAGLGLEFVPPGDLCARVLRRLFPWAPTDGDPWAVLRWANGRAALAARPRLDPGWFWHCAPLDEWDGTIARRSAPPAW